MATINIADKQTLDTINQKLDAVDIVCDNIYSKVDTEVASIVSATAANTTANKSGTLSQKDTYIISLLENTTYGLNALKSALGSGSSVIKSIQRGVITIAKGSSSSSATISSVNTSKAIVVFGGFGMHYESSYSDLAFHQSHSYLTLESATKVTATRNAAQGTIIVTVPYQVIEYV